jgi:hypothetical protein
MHGIYKKLDEYNKNKINDKDKNNKINKKDKKKIEKNDKNENLIFINVFKNFILELGVCDKKFYEQCVREIIYNKNNFQFIDFLECFKRLLNLKYEQNFLKYKFLLQIVPRQNLNYIEEDELKNFSIITKNSKKVDKELSKKIYKYLATRYKKIFPKDEKLNLRKMTMILELFFEIK